MDGQQGVWTHEAGKDCGVRLWGSHRWWKLFHKFGILWETKRKNAGSAPGPKHTESPCRCCCFRCHYHRCRGQRQTPPPCAIWKNPSVNQMSYIDHVMASTLTNAHVVIVLIVPASPPRAPSSQDSFCQKTIFNCCSLCSKVSCAAPMSWTKTGSQRVSWQRKWRPILPTRESPWRNNCRTFIRSKILISRVCGKNAVSDETRTIYCQEKQLHTEKYLSVDASHFARQNCQMVSIGHCPVGLSGCGQPDILSITGPTRYRLCGVILILCCLLNFQIRIFLQVRLPRFYQLLLLVLRPTSRAESVPQAA